MSEEGKFYWLRVKSSRNPPLYVGETKAGRMKYTQHVMKPSCCIVYKGGPKLDAHVAEINQKGQAEFNEKQAAFELKYPPGTIPAEISPTLYLYEAVEVVSYFKKGKTTFNYVKKGKTAFKLKDKKA